MFEEETQNYTIFLEKNGFQTVASYLEKVAKTDEGVLFSALVYNNDILLKLYKHQVSLAIFISRHLKVEVLPEDRSRLVYMLAKLADTDYEKANQEMKKEFGASFELPENIAEQGKTYNWKSLAVRAKEIKRGIYNNCYLQVYDLVKVFHKYFTLFRETDPQKLEQINKLSQEIITALNSSPILGMPNSEKRKDVILKIQTFYQLTNRIKLDVKKIEDDPDFQAVLEYTIAIRMACKIRLELLSKKLSPFDSNYAMKYLLRNFGEDKFNNLLSLDELQRFGQPLAIKKA